jgi:hypothetical protein
VVGQRLGLRDDAAIEDAAAALDRGDLEAEILLDQIAQRIGTVPRLILVSRPARSFAPHAREAAGDDLAAQPVARLEDMDVAGGAGLRRQIPRGEQAAGTAADDRDTEIPTAIDSARADRFVVSHAYRPNLLASHARGSFQIEPSYFYREVCVAKDQL